VNGISSIESKHLPSIEESVMLTVLVTALACVWASGRIFRVGLLLQGKGVRFADLMKWVVRG
jgi:hypothetical protein